MGANIEADIVGKLNRPHGHTKLAGGGIDLFFVFTLFEPLHGREHIGRQHGVDEEARHILGDERELVDGCDKRRPLARFVFAGPRATHHFDERHLGDRRKEMQANETAGVFERGCNVFELERRGVGCHHGAGLHLLFKIGKQLLLDVETFDDGFNHNIRTADAVPIRVGDKARLSGITQRLGFKLTRNELALRFDAVGELIFGNILQRHFHAGRHTHAGNVGAHGTSPNHMHARGLPSQALGCLRLQRFREFEHPAQTARLFRYDQRREGRCFCDLHGFKVAAMFFEQVDQPERCRIVILARLLGGLCAHFLGERYAGRPCAKN